MNFDEVMKELETLGTEQNRKIYHNHGNDLPLYGVSVANLKKVLKPIKKNKELGKKLFYSGITDAIYLSQWIADPYDLTSKDYEYLINLTDYYMILDNVIPNILVQNKELAFTLLPQWLDHTNHRFRQVGYSLFAIILSKYPNEDINPYLVEKYLNHVKNSIHQEANRVRYSMNSFVICAGVYDPKFTAKALKVAEEIGKVSVSMGETSCKVPFAPASIRKIESMNRIGKKR
jgi:3-methyladenine DNA glycosylase AlkD